MARRTKLNTYLIREPRNDSEEPILFPWTEKVAKLSDYRPYHGPLKEADGSPVNVDTLRAYLRGETRKGNPQFDLSPETFDIGKASKGMLVDFAERNYSITLDLSQDIDELRAQVAKLATAAGDADEEVAKAVTGRQRRMNQKPDAYPTDDEGAIRRAKALAAAKGVNIPKL